MYDGQDWNRFRLIRTLRLANYSLTAILRLLQKPVQPGDNLRQIVNTPAAHEEIVSICDQLLTSLANAEVNGRQVLAKLADMARQFANPPL